MVVRLFQLIFKLINVDESLLYLTPPPVEVCGLFDCSGHGFITRVALHIILPLSSFHISGLSLLVEPQHYHVDTE